MFKDKNDIRHLLLCKTTVAPSDSLVTTLNNVVNFLSTTIRTACDDHSSKFIKFLRSIRTYSGL